ncbi:hypothetical protein ACFFTN_00280 [Aminobacter aganoensis]|uniref:Uncharacterized protein n=1 Tax=Aminobacter aganoensis TaxID=83264 RepID=A0A7X0F5W7_9HYPH|nr:hypothetical protein [Aminobacter aganoensis]MBB6353711.1 hypothetical protein [Aminobacter aganoensis]
MTDQNGQPGRPEPLQDVTTELVRLMPRDLIFTMRFLGESQHRLQRHFQDFIETEMRSAGMTPQTHPMLHAFIERHAIMLRDFVFSGVSLSRQFHVDEIERLIGDTTSLLRVDIWDDLKSHIEAAEKQFRSQVPRLPNLLSDWESPAPDTPEDGQ